MAKHLPTGEKKAACISNLCSKRCKGSATNSLIIKKGGGGLFIKGVERERGVSRISLLQGRKREKYYGRKKRPKSRSVVREGGKRNILFSDRRKEIPIPLPGSVRGEGSCPKDEE